ncbi:unnamed protein product, partial [Symbiodinium microadriaticum]
MDVPAGTSVEDAVDFLRAAEARTWAVELRLSQLERSLKDLEARLNTVQLRLCCLEEDFKAFQAQLVGSQGIPLQSEVSILRHLVTELTEVSNRISPEVGRLLVWRQRFTESLQAQLLLIGHQFALACAQIAAQNGLGKRKFPLDDVISHNQHLDFRSKRISMPWNQGIFQYIFREPRSREPLLPLPSPPPGLFSDGGASVQQTPAEALPAATHAFAKQRARLAALVQSDDAVRFEALRKIKTLTLLDPPSSELGRHIIAEAAILSDPERLQKSFNDTFATKSTATLAKRAASFWRFAEFCLASDFGSPFRAGESIVYAYVQNLQAHGAATSANSFLESWNFFASLLGFANRAGQSPISGRVRGAAASLAATKKRLVQATPLSVAMLRALERIVVKPPYPHWQVIAGHILFCVGSCARFSDTIHLQSLDLSSADGMHLLE